MRQKTADPPNDLSPVKTRSWFQQVFFHPYIPILLLLLTNIIIGHRIVGDYGESWDELFRYRYARKSLRAYFGSIKYPDDEKGPFYVMIARLGSEGLDALKTNRPPIDNWHFMHFLSFQMGVFFLYAICLRFMNKWASFGTALLFVSQPLLWGHAFINPKDIPFMSFFLGSIALGLWMADSPPKIFFSDEGSISSKISSDLNSLDRRTFRRILWICGLSLASLLFLLLVLLFVRAALALVINHLYAASPETLLARIFSRIAQNKELISPESYIRKGTILYARFVSYYAVLVISLVLASVWRLFPTTIVWLWRERILPALSLPIKVLLAGMFLGFCTSIRALGPASGLLVSIYFLYKSGRKALPVLLIYSSIALIITYATWPNLWSDPINRFIGSLSESANFPFDAKVLFDGLSFKVDELPRHYLPVLLSIQFTESALLLFLLGVVVALKHLIRGSTNRGLISLILAWFFIPVSYVILMRPNMYDNFRHFLFVIPAMFLIAGLGMQALLDRLKSPALKSILLTILILPNIYWLIQLHPYQYVYYNSLVGGVGGAFRRFEMDYWVTSYLEAAHYINESAPRNSTVIVSGPSHLVKNYARKDLNILDLEDGGLNETTAADYAVISSRSNDDLNLFPKGELVFQIGRDGAVFTVIKRLPSTGTPGP